jgi:nicotinate phosphoribosyltransferase
MLRNIADGIGNCSSENIDIRLTTDDIIMINYKGELELYVDAPLRRAMWYEVPLLAIIEETYMRYMFQQKTLDNFDKYCEDTIKSRTYEKIKKLKRYKYAKEVKIADFGTRRRASFLAQETAIKVFLEEVPSNFIGTSNMLLANKYSIQPVGTMAHWYQMLFQYISPLKTHLKDALYHWIRAHDGKYLIALTDTLGINYFLSQFSYGLAKIYDGCRQDSGDPITAGEKIINHYKKLGIDPKTKTIVFSDNLNIDLIIKIHKHFRGRINMIFGVGTNITNDIGLPPLPIVIKLTKIDGMPVAKLSDSEEKNIGPDYYINYLRNTILEEEE